MAACPPLEALVRRIAARSRRRRIVAGLAGGAGLGAATTLVLEVHRFLESSVGPAPYGHGTAIGAGVAAGAAVLLVAVAFARRAADETRIVVELDRRFGLGDVLPAALAICRGRTQPSALAPLVLAQAGAAVQSLPPDLRGVLADPLAERVARRIHGLVVVALIALLAFVVFDWLRSLHLPFGFMFGAGDVGIIPRQVDDAPGRFPGTGARGATDPTGTGENVPPSAPGRSPEPTAKPAPDAPPDAPRGPELTVTAKPSRTTYRDGEAVLVTVGAVPTRTPERDRELSVSMELDGHEAPPGTTLRIGPGTPLGAGEIQDLRRIPALADRLPPGEHTVRARLRDRNDGTSFDSEPATFRVEGDPGGGGGGAGAQQPKPQPQAGDPSPSLPPQAGDPSPSLPPPPPVPEKPPGEGARPPTPEVPVAFEKQIVIPLFGDGEQVKKEGLRVVLVPGEGPGDPPRRAPLEEVLPEAARRAESHVDAAGVRAADADLVRRYFEELRRSLR